MQREPLRVLLIEHDSTFADTVATLLGQQREIIGEVARTSSLTEGLTRLADTRFDIVILDFSLPDGAGLANIALLRAQ
jgi:DNA-binding NarL/FixJ family response regulator